MLSAVVCLVALAACSPDHIDSGNVLTPGNALESSNGYKALMDTNGQLVIKKPDGTSGWHTQTAGHPGAQLTVQTDGNVVLGDTDGTTLWSTNTASLDQVPATLTMQTDGNLVLSAEGHRMWSSAFGNAACYGSGCQVLSSYETNGNGSLAGRDCGYSAPMSNGVTSLWLFCDTPVTPTGGSMGFIPGSTAATGYHYPSMVSQALYELPSGSPHQFLPTPTGLTLKSGGLCGSDRASYAASWATGLASVPGAPNMFIIPFENYCVQASGADKGMWAQGYGIAEYDSSTGAMTYHQSVLPQSSTLAAPSDPVFDSTSNSLYFFLNCAPFGCPTNAVYVARVTLGSDPATDKPWADGQNYEYWTGSAWSTDATAASPVTSPGLANWDITVQRFPALGNQYVMVAMTDFSGGYEVLTSTSPTGPWTQRSTGTIADCQTEPSGKWCYAYNLHPESSTTTKLALTTLNPRRGHVTLEMIPW